MFSSYVYTLLTTLSIQQGKFMPLFPICQIKCEKISLSMETISQSQIKPCNKR